MCSASRRKVQHGGGGRSAWVGNPRLTACSVGRCGRMPGDRSESFWCKVQKPERIGTTYQGGGRLGACSASLLFWQAEPFADRVLTVLPTNDDISIPSKFVNLLLPRRRLRLSLLLTPRNCSCRAGVDPIGDHRSECATSSRDLLCYCLQAQPRGMPSLRKSPACGQAAGDCQNASNVSQQE